VMLGADCRRRWPLAELRAACSGFRGSDSLMRVRLHRMAARLGDVAWQTYAGYKLAGCPADDYMGLVLCPRCQSTAAVEEHPEEAVAVCYLCGWSVQLSRAPRVGRPAPAGSCHLVWAGQDAYHPPLNATYYRERMPMCERFLMAR